MLIMSVCISAGQCRHCPQNINCSQSLCPHKPEGHMAKLSVLDSRTPEKWVRALSQCT